MMFDTCLPSNSSYFRRLVALLLMALLPATPALAQTPISTCDMQGIGAVSLDAEGDQVTIVEVSAETADSIPFCLVKLRIPEAINIWVGLPMDGRWNGRWQSTGGGGYAGTVNVPANALRMGFAAASTDTGHTAQVGGSFAMLAPGRPNLRLQEDFAWRSEHLMAVLGKQLVEAFYGEPPVFSYWNGCSTGGRQGLRMAQDFPADYDGILAGAPAIHWDRFQAGQIWYQVVQLQENGGPIGGGDRDVLIAKQQLATARAIEACDAMDGVADGIIDDPRQCSYGAAADVTITSAQCAASDPACLTPGEASAIDRMWLGPVSCTDGSADCSVPATATRDLDSVGNKRLWYANTRGANLAALGGATPFNIAVSQPRFWVYFDPDWDWQTLDYGNYLQFFRDSVRQVGPMMASDNPDLTAYRDSGGKVLMYHGWADPLIAPQGSIDYYERLNAGMAGDFSSTREFARLFMAPGVGHCAGGDGPQPQGMFESLVDWVENGVAPDTILATRQTNPGQTESRPLCPYPARAQWNGQGSAQEAGSYTCVVE